MEDNELFEADLARRAGSEDISVASAAQSSLSLAAGQVIREAILSGEIWNYVFASEKWDAASTPEYPLDIIAPGEESNIVAYAVPSHGKMPSLLFEADSIRVPTYEVGADYEIRLKLLRSNPAYALRVEAALKSAFATKMNNDGFRTIMAAAYSRGLVIYDNAASVGQMTKRLLDNMANVMSAAGGGNSASRNRIKLTDVFCSMTGKSDISNWNIDEIPESKREVVYYNSESSVVIPTAAGPVRVSEMTELGVGQDYQNFYLNSLGGTLASTDVELVLGLCLNNKPDSFVMPIVMEPDIREKMSAHERGMAAWYGRAELGCAVLDNRYVLAGSF